MVLALRRRVVQQVVVLPSMAVVAVLRAAGRQLALSMETVAQAGNPALLELMALQAAQTLVLAHSLVELPHLALRVVVVPVAALTQQQPLQAARVASPVVVLAAEDRPSQAAQRQRVVLVAQAL